MFYYILMGLIALLAVVLILIILLQSGQGGGLAGIAAGGATQQVLGTRQAPDMLERLTWAGGALFLVLCIMTNFVVDRGDAPESVIQQRAGDQTEQQPMMPQQQQTPLQQEGSPEPPQPVPDEQPQP